MDTETQINELTAVLSASNAGYLPDVDAMDADGFFRLLPWGDYQHEDVGAQLLDISAGNSAARHFRNAWAKIKSMVGARHEPPIYWGHPDEAAFGEKYQNTTRYGELKEIQPREDGLYVRTEFTPDGQRLLADAKAKGQKLFYSPRFLLRPISDTATRVVGILSLGLTPQPNIRDVAAANSKPEITDTMKPDQLNKLRELYKLPATATADEVFAKVEAAANATVSASNEQAETGRKVLKLEGDISAANEKALKAEQDLATEKEAHKATEQARQTALTSASNARAEHRESLLTAAQLSGRITPGERPSWKTRFETDFVSASNALATLKPAVKTATTTGNLRERSPEEVTAKVEIRTEVEKLISASNGKLPYEKAFLQVKRNPKFKSHFELLNQQSGERAQEAAK